MLPDVPVREDVRGLEWCRVVLLLVQKYCTVMWFPGAEILFVSVPCSLACFCGIGA